MSEFSGKCDLYDSAVMIGEYDIKNIRLFITKGNRSYPIKLEEPRDLIPYYPYIPYVSSYSNGIYRAYLSDSYIDREEREILTRELEYLLRDYRRCKRKKIPFDKSQYNNIWYNQEIVERIVTEGEKATIEGIHLPMQNHWRKRLAEEMEKNGYTDNEIINAVYPDMIWSNFNWRTDDY